jgi:Zn-dependent peptidase ImmA (M78 family)
LFLEGVEEEGMLTSTEEQEANDFAARVLVPDVYRQPLVTIAIDAHQIIRFARKIGISPGIVVGQLQHLGRIKPRQMNSLKRRYEWQDQ